jgi:small ligand-binding sensory domain FIST
MRFTSGISDAADAKQAAEAVCAEIRAQLGGQPCDLALVFASTIYRADWPQLLAQVQQQLAPTVLVGCSGSGIIGGTQELEWVPAISIVGARLPDVKLHPFYVAPDELELSSAGGFWVDKIGASPHSQPVFILFADPYTCQPMKLVDEISATYRARPIVGGLVSGGNEPGEQFIFHHGEVMREGAVGVALTGNIAMDTVISQGCRPIGRPYAITKSDENAILELGGRQALSVLHEVLSTLSVDDRELAQRGSIFIGLVINEMRQSFGAGDFLIRNIVGIDPDVGAIAVAEQVKLGQTIQFQLRDPATSRQELRRLLQQVQPSQVVPPAGCLLFNCTGRGKSLYGSAHQDLKTIQTISGKVPIGGFFCNGEIGPVGGMNFVHGYTASIGLFRPQHVPVFPEMPKAQHGQAT